MGDCSRATYEEGYNKFANRDRLTDGGRARDGSYILEGYRQGGGIFLHC